MLPPGDSSGSPGSALYEADGQTEKETRVLKGPLNIWGSLEGLVGCLVVNYRSL